MAREPVNLVYVNFTAKVKDTDEAVETTIEEESKKLGIYDQARRYEPRLVAVGEGWMLKGLEDEIGKMAIGEKKTIELAPSKAYGERDSTQVRMIPLRKFGEKAAELRVGDVVEIDNRIGVVRFVGSGRAQVDFNHRLAGKTLVYDLETVKKLESDDEVIRGLIGRRLPGEAEKLTFSRSEDKVSIEVSEELFLTDGLQIIKRGIANDITHFIPMVKEVTFRETYRSKEKSVEEGKKEETAAAPTSKEDTAEEKNAEKTS
jgi:peptidylprolyl isomerase